MPGRRDEETHPRARVVRILPNTHGRAHLIWVLAVERLEGGQDPNMDFLAELGKQQFREAA